MSEATILARGEDRRTDALAAALLARGVVDARSLERGQSVATETGPRLDAVLIQLGLVGERALADPLDGFTPARRR
jgi:hypothetical protein